MNQKPIVAVLMTNAERAKELSARLGVEGMEAMVAGGTDDLYRMLNHQRVDLVIIENDLRGFLSGLEILQRLYSDLLRPATILLAVASTDVQRQARELGIDQILPTTDRIDAVASAAAGLIVANQHSQVVIPAAARQLVLRSDSIRPLPQLLVKLSSYLDDDSTSMADLARDISVDPKITAELLKLTNSTAMGIRRKMGNVQEAVNYLGIRKTVTLVLAASIVGSQVAMQKSLPDEFRSWYNCRSVLIASTASTVARQLEDVAPETAYVVGLLQDLGMLLLAEAFEGRYVQLASRVRLVAQLRLEICERDDFGITHADVSAALLQKWGLPQSLVSLVLNHHPRAGAEEHSTTERRFLRAARIGEAVANLSDRPSPQRYQPLNQLLAEYGETRTEQCRACLAEAVAKTAESSRMFSVPVPDENQLHRLLQRINLQASCNAAEDVAEMSAPTADIAPAPAVDVFRKGSVEESCHVEDVLEVACPVLHQILVVEDDPVVIQLIRRMLQPQGPGVVACRTVSDALALAENCSLVLCDVHLGKETGVDLMRALRANGYPGAMIVMSGDHTRGTVQECIAAGIHDYLLKPFDRRALLEKLAKFIDLPGEMRALPPARPAGAI